MTNNNLFRQAKWAMMLLRIIGALLIVLRTRGFLTREESKAIWLGYKGDLTDMIDEIEGE